MLSLSDVSARLAVGDWRSGGETAFSPAGALSLP
jgi:hypothetical protein